MRSRRQPEQEEHRAAAAASHWSVERVEAACSSARESGCCEARVLRRGAEAEAAILQTRRSRGERVSATASARSPLPHSALLHSCAHGCQPVVCSLDVWWWR